MIVSDSSSLIVITYIATMPGNGRTDEKNNKEQPAAQGNNS